MSKFNAKEFIEQRLSKDGTDLRINYLHHKNFTENKKKQIFSEISKLKSLTRLNLDRNKITDASFLTELKLLTSLHLNNNQIKDASFLAELKSLKTLDLSDNQITDASFLTKLKSLKWLKLSNNKISDASFLTELKSLEVLYLGNNKISDASFLAELKSLKGLQLSVNQISDASFLVELKSLTWLNLDGNQNLNLPEKFKKKFTLNKDDIKEIVQYYEQLEKEGKDYIYEAKVLIVGEPNAGKTTLFRKLQNYDYYPQKATKEEKESTIGVNIGILEFPINHKRQFKAHLWDFGGQEKQYALHQYFFTERSLYVLLADDRKELGNFNYWFEIIATLGVGCPVLVVLNEINSKVTNFDISVYKREFGEKIQEIEEKSVNFANNEDGRFINLANEIKTKLKNLPQIGQALPKTWVKVRKELSEIGKPFISIEDYEEICEKCGVEKPEYRKQILEYLHDLGVALNYRNDDNLRFKLILRPNWVIDALYAVLKDKKIIDNKGKFTADEVFELWRGYKSDEKTILLQLMQKGKFEVAYKLAGTNAYIAPILLPEISPLYDFNETNSLQIHFDYRFKPKGIISRLIVRFHENIVSQNGEQKVWKKGVLLQNKNSIARIIESEQRRKIEITVSGKSAYENREFITIISNEIKKIHCDWFENRLNFEEKVMCDCAECMISDEPYFFKLESLVRKLSKGITNATCDKSDKEVNILPLLEGVYIEEEKPVVKEFQAEYVFNIAGDFNSSYVSGKDNIVLQAVKGSQINIQKQIIDEVSAKMNEPQTLEISKIADEIIKLIEANAKENNVDLNELAEAKKGKWEAKLKFSLPFIPLEFSREITPDEYISKVRKWLYGDDSPDKFLKD